MRSLFITATDTGVGKTFIAAGLAATLQSHGIKVGVMKPVATGCRRQGQELVSEDAQYLIDAAQVEDPVGLVNPIALKEPLSPNVAARRSGRSVPLDKIWRAYRRLCGRHEVLIVEGIGGLMVPIRDDFFVADMARKLNLPLLIVARPTLGTLNHTLLTVRMAQRYGLRVQGIVLNYNRPWKKGVAERTNPRVLKEIARVPIFEVPFIPRKGLHQSVHPVFDKLAAALFCRPRRRRG